MQIWNDAERFDAPLRGLVPVMLLCSMELAATGCVLRIGPDIDTIEVNQNENAEKNLDSIRAMQADRYRRVPVEGARPSLSTMSPDMPTEMTPSSQARPLLNTPPPGVSDRAQLARPGTRTQPHSSGVPPSPPDRFVPAYTIPAPVGPNQGGSIRCVPDGLGGQRCMAHQP